MRTRRKSRAALSGDPCAHVSWPSSWDSRDNLDRRSRDRPPPNSGIERKKKRFVPHPYSYPTTYPRISMAVVISSFDSWLTKKLQALNTDEGVFGTYIRGILEGDESDDEKTEALEGILAGITEDNIAKHVAEILAAWVECLHSDDLAGTSAPAEDVEVRLAKMLESQCLPTTARRSYTDEEKRIREAILAQYSETVDEEGSEEEGEEEVAGADGGIEKNTNASNIAQQEKGKREQAKLKSLQKKEKDKEDREKRKQLKEEKKEKRKTQKGERRR